MSGGQRQTVAIARALYFNARILIMDEPCAALGPSETRMVMDTIRRLKDHGIAIFLISHDMHDVFEACDRVTVLKNGRVVGTQKVAEVTQDDVLGMIILGKNPPPKVAA
jgi:D-xylose transport system ATP-binding protein